MASHGTTAAEPAEGLRLLRWQRKDSAIFAYHQEGLGHGRPEPILLDSQ